MKKVAWTWGWVDCVQFLLALDFGTNIFGFLEMVEAMKNVASLDM